MNLAQQNSRMTAVVLMFALLAMHCSDKGTNPPVVPERVKLTLIDVGVREAYLHVAISNPGTDETFDLRRNGATVITHSALSDTMLADTGLTQNTAYQYNANLTTSGSTSGASNTVSAQTLMPTSHDFTWETFLLGDGNNSTLNDVALVNDSLAYACGEIYLGSDPLPYNLVKWNGDSCELKRVTVQTRFGLVTAPLEGVFAFSPNDMWLVATDPIHGDGQNWVDYDIRMILGDEGLSVSHAWGSSSTYTYFVGRSGNIVLFSSGTWQRIGSGTTTQINDAWGVVNPVTGKTEVYCAASSFFEPGAEKKILRITEQIHVDSLTWNTGRNIFSLWTRNGFPVFTAGSGVFENSSGRWREVPLPGIYTNVVRGNSPADIIVAGDLGFVAHFGGEDWHVFTNVYNAQYFSLAMRNDLVVLVGQRNANGVITIGRR